MSSSRIVAAGEPGRRAAVLDVLAAPGFRARLAALRHGPEAPDLLAGPLIVRGEEPVGAVLAAGHAGNDHVARHGERRRGGRVVLPPVVHRGIPQQLAGEAVQRQQVRVVGDHEQRDRRRRATPRFAWPDGRPSIAAADSARSGGRCRHRARSIRSDSATYMMPDDDDRRGLRAAAAGHREDPFRREPRDVGLVDLGHRGVAVAARDRRCRSASRSDDVTSRNRLADPAQQVHALVVGRAAARR